MAASPGELYRAVTGQLTQELGRTPSEPDLARDLGVSAANLRDARRAELALRPYSLDAPLSESSAASLADRLGGQDPRIDHILSMTALATHWGELPQREQQILVLRFRGGMTQAQIGQQLGISQMHVCRLLAHALGYLRPRLLGLADCPDRRGSLSQGTDQVGPPSRRACALLGSDRRAGKHSGWRLW